MISFEDAELQRLAVHFVGSRIQEEPLAISDGELKLDPDVNQILKKYFTRPFRETPFHCFQHESDLALNECYTFAKEIFQSPESLYINSVKLAKHLYAVSDHPNIKSGEFYVAWFDQVYVGDEICQAVGLFKSENKETFLKVFPENKNYRVEHEQGVNINKLDKGCIIFDIEPENGYRLAAIDNTNKNGEARYWIDKFLKAKPRQDNYYHTHNYLTMCRDFAMEVFPEASMADRLALANDSADYFRKTEVFDKNDFYAKTLQTPEIIEAFEDYKVRYQQEKDLNLADEFEVAPSAVKRLKQVFKSVIKLDKNFHIYVHGNRDLIRRGYDEESKMHFYQLFFREES